MATWATLTQDRIHSPTEVGVLAKHKNMTHSSSKLSKEKTNISTQPQITHTSNNTISQSLDTDSLDNGIYSTTTPSHDLPQTSLATPKENHPFGDLISTPKREGDLRIYFQNVNSIYKFRDWNSLREASAALHDYKVDIFGFAETNIKWNLRLKNQVTNILQKDHKIVQTTTSSSNEPSRTIYQPGGTITTATSKYTGRIRGIITDDTTMGRWSGFTFSTNFQHNIHLITVYQSVKSEGIHSTYKQQQSKLADMGHRHPNPRKQLIEDLQVLIQKWNGQNDKTIILIDANDNLYNKDSLLPNFLSQTNLTSLIPNSFDHPPPQHMPEVQDVLITSLEALLWFNT
jgi:hypothetical protein